MAQSHTVSQQIEMKRSSQLKRSPMKRGTSVLKRGRMKVRRYSKTPTVDGDSLRDLKDDCDALIRTIVALRDEKCVIVDCKQTENLHVGHYIKRGVLALRWDTRNCNAQCDFHNEAHNTDPKPYQSAMILKYGIGVTWQIEGLAKDNPRVTYVELLQIRNRLRAEVVRVAQ